jgi:hypothetical protein
MRSDIRTRIDMLIEQLNPEGYAEHRQRVGELIARCRATLARGTGRLGSWEAGQLDMAERATIPIF